MSTLYFIIKLRQVIILGFKVGILSIWAININFIIKERTVELVLCLHIKVGTKGQYIAI